MGKPGKRPALSLGGSCSRFWSLGQASLVTRDKSANGSFEAPGAPPPWVAMQLAPETEIRAWKAIRILSVCLSVRPAPLGPWLPPPLSPAPVLHMAVYVAPSTPSAGIKSHKRKPLASHGADAHPRRVLLWAGQIVQTCGGSSGTMWMEPGVVAPRRKE